MYSFDHFQHCIAIKLYLIIISGCPFSEVWMILYLHSSSTLYSHFSYLFGISDNSNSQ